MGVTWVLQGSFSGGTDMFKLFFSWVSQGCYMDSTQVFQNCLIGVTGCCRVLRECYRGLTGVLHDCNRSVTEHVLQNLFGTS